MCVCVRACARACVCACVRACVCQRMSIETDDGICEEINTLPSPPKLAFPYLDTVYMFPHTVSSHWRLIYTIAFLSEYYL